jgi:hypothetical protein
MRHSYMLLELFFVREKKERYYEVRIEVCMLFTETYFVESVF